MPAVGPRGVIPPRSRRGAVGRRCRRRGPGRWPRRGAVGRRRWVVGPRGATGHVGPRDATAPRCDGAEDLGVGRRAELLVDAGPLVRAVRRCRGPRRAWSCWSATPGRWPARCDTACAELLVGDAGPLARAVRRAEVRALAGAELLVGDAGSCATAPGIRALVAARSCRLATPGRWPARCDGAEARALAGARSCWWATPGRWPARWPGRWPARGADWSVTQGRWPARCDGAESPAETRPRPPRACTSLVDADLQPGPAGGMPAGCRCRAHAGRCRCRAGCRAGVPVPARCWCRHAGGTGRRRGGRRPREPRGRAEPGGVQRSSSGMHGSRGRWRRRARVSWTPRGLSGGVRRSRMNAGPSAVYEECRPESRERWAERPRRRSATPGRWPARCDGAEGPARRAVGRRRRAVGPRGATAPRAPT